MEFLISFSIVLFGVAGIVGSAFLFIKAVMIERNKRSILFIFLALGVLLGSIILLGYRF